MLQKMRSLIGTAFGSVIDPILVYGDVPAFLESHCVNQSLFLDLLVRT